MLEEINNKIKELESKKLQINDLKEAQKIKLLLFKYRNSVGKEEEKSLNEKVGIIMKKKFKDAFPDFNDETVEKMMTSYNFGYFYVPYDIEIFDKLVFCRVHVYDDFGFLNEDKVYSLSNNLLGIDSAEFEVSPLRSYGRREEFLKYFDSEEIAKKVSDFICNSINQMCEKELIFPIYTLNTDNVYYGNKGFQLIDYNNQILISHNYDSICKAMYTCETIIMDLVTIENNDICLYKVEQCMVNDLPQWKLINKISNSWKMSLSLKQKHN